MSQHNIENSLPKRIEQMGYSFKVRIFNEALQIVDGDVEKLTDQIYDSALTKVIQQYINDHSPQLISQLDDYKVVQDNQRKQIDALEIQLQLEVTQSRELEKHFEQELETQRSALNHTTDLLTKANENNGSLKRELVSVHKRLKTTRNALISERGVSNNLNALLERASNKPQKTPSQRILGLALTLIGGGVAFTWALPVFVNSLITGNSDTAIQAGLLALGGFIAVSAVENNFLGLFETKEQVPKTHRLRLNLLNTLQNHETSSQTDSPADDVSDSPTATGHNSKMSGKRM